MKLIVDFDDVLFDVGTLKEKFFTVLEARGIQNARDEYVFERKNDRPFSLRLFLKRICGVEGMSESEVEVMYQEIMSVCHDLRNVELLELFKENGKENCFIVTSGEEEFQLDKIKRTGADEYVSEVIVVPGTKKAIVESLCIRFTGEQVIFIDDKQKFFDDITMEKCPNLRTMLFDKYTVDLVREAIREGRDEIV